MRIQVLPFELTIGRFKEGRSIPDLKKGSIFFSVTKTDEEVTVVCEPEYMPPGIETESGWSVLKLEGPLDFHLTGVLSEILIPLAEHRISVYTISTYSTDYVLVKGKKLSQAIQVLSVNHEIVS